MSIHALAAQLGTSIEYYRKSKGIEFALAIEGESIVISANADPNDKKSEPRIGGILGAVAERHRLTAVKDKGRSNGTTVVYALNPR